jgi:hypothetical protein
VDPLTSITILLVVGGPWAYGVYALIRKLVGRLDRLDREEPLYGDPMPPSWLEKQR